jgi:hypothetical protein
LNLARIGGDVFAKVHTLKVNLSCGFVRRCRSGTDGIASRGYTENPATRSNNRVASPARASVKDLHTSKTLYIG